MNGYPNEGDDKRIDLFGILKWLQNVLSFHSTKPPHWIIRSTGRFQYWLPGPQPFVSFGVAWPPYLVRQSVLRDGRIAGPDDWRPGKVALFRAGWRYDPNWEGGGYIFPTLAWKRNQGAPMGKGY